MNKTYPREYRLEDDLLIKTRPKIGSKRWWRLKVASGFASSKTCEICGALLLNPHSILIHQGKVCQNRIKDVDLGKSFDKLKQNL